MATEDRAPWEVIRAAADKIQSLELHAVSGPWESGERCVWNTSNGLAVVADGNRGDGGCFSEGTAAWIAALSPAVAEPLVAWLRTAAGSLELHVPVWETTHPSGRAGPGRTAEQVAGLVEHHFGHALVLSRVILGAVEGRQ